MELLDAPPTQLDPVEEDRMIRRLQFMMGLVMQTIAQDSSLSIDDAAQMIADSKKAALAMFPDKGTRLRNHLETPLPAADARALPHHVEHYRQRSAGFVANCAKT